MPLARISLRKGKPAAYRKAISDGVYRALRETFNVPEEDRFMIVSQHDPEDLDYSRSYLDIERSDDFMVIQLTVSNTRGVEQKKALYRRIVELLGENPGVRPQDVFINLVEGGKEEGELVFRERYRPICVMGKVMQESREQRAADALAAWRPPPRELSPEEADEMIAAHLLGMGVAAALIIGIAGALALIGRMFV